MKMLLTNILDQDYALFTVAFVLFMVIAILCAISSTFPPKVMAGFIIRLFNFAYTFRVDWPQTSRHSIKVVLQSLLHCTESTFASLIP